jgi:hypothetical protein
VLPARHELATLLSGTVREFELLNQQLQKSGAMKFSSGQVAVRSACSTFVVSFGSLTDLLVQIKRCGTGPLIDAVSSSFDEILSALGSLQPNSVHDPLGKVVTSLVQQAQSGRRAALRRLVAASGPVEHAQLLAEMRPLRQLADDIAQVPFDSGRALTACNDILQGVRGGLLFAGDISIISTTFEEFRRSLDAVAVLLEVPVGHIPMELRGSDTEGVSISIDDGMDLVSALAAGHELLVQWFGASGKLSQMFEMFKRKATALKSNGPTTTDNLKKLCGEVHFYATGQRLDDVPADDVRLLRQLRLDAEALDQQKTRSAETIASAKRALASIVSGSDLVAVAQTVQSQYTKLDMQVQIILTKILRELGQTQEFRSSDDAMNWIIAGIRTQREAAASFAERCGFEPSTPLPELIVRASEDRAMLKKVRKKLADFLNTDDDAVPTLLSKLEAGDDPRLIALEGRLRALVSCDATPVADRYARIGALVDALQRSQRVRQVELVRPRALAEAALQKLRRSVGLGPAENARAMEMEAMLEQMSQLCDQIGAETSMASQISINYMFENVFPYFSTTSRTNPAVYIPEFCREFVVQAKSIEALLPFNRVLDEISKTFDYKPQSFHPRAESFGVIRDKSFALQKLLNEIGPQPLHARVFTLLSNFTSLLSSFVSAILSFGAALG